jgi:DNA mismatch endonuclease (patch repair protein)
MAKVLTKEGRSRIMRNIRSKNTKIEKKLRSALWKRGLRYRIHYKLPGRPDIVFPSKKLVVFIDGDFWHGYNWKNKGIIPPAGFWQEKIERNIKRDKEQTKKLKKQGWIVLRFWEHEVNEDINYCIKKIKQTLSK